MSLSRSSRHIFARYQVIRAETFDCNYRRIVRNLRYGRWRLGDLLGSPPALRLGKCNLR